MTQTPDTVERELRQLRLMLDRIDRFRSGELALGHVIADLEQLLYELEMASDAWRDEFTEAWSLLEITYAEALHRSEPLPTIANADVAVGLGEMERLAGARLGELRSNESPLP